MRQQVVSGSKSDESMREARIVDAGYQHRLTPHLASADAIPVPVPLVPVKHALDGLATVAKATHGLLTKAKADENGFVRCGSSAAFACVLSTGTVQRAALVLDALEVAFPLSGIKLLHDRERKVITLEADGEQLTLTLSEGYSRTEHVEKHPEYHWMDRRTYTYHFNGRLTLTLDGRYQGRKSWSDGVRAGLEAKLGDFVAGIGAAAMAIREARVAAQERARRWEEQARLEAIEADKARRLKAFRVQFSEEAQAWQRHREAKAYLDHLRGQLPRDGLALPPEAQAWMEQAERAVERLDTGLRRLTGC